MLVPGFRGVGPWRFGELSQYSDSSLLCWCRASAGWGRGVSGSFRSTVTVTVPNCAGAGLPGWAVAFRGAFAVPNCAGAGLPGGAVAFRGAFAVPNCAGVGLCGCGSLFRVPGSNGFGELSQYSFQIVLGRRGSLFRGAFAVQ